MIVDAVVQRPCQSKVPRPAFAYGLRKSLFALKVFIIAQMHQHTQVCWHSWHANQHCASDLRLCAPVQLI